MVARHFFSHRSLEFSDILSIASRISDRPVESQKKWLHALGPTGRKDLREFWRGSSFSTASEPSSLHVRIGIIHSSGMGNLVRRRPLTGCVRRKAKNVTSSYGHVMHLNKYYL